MIKVFGQTDKTFVTNGDVVLRPFKAKVTKKDNGDYFLDLECGLEYIDYILEGNIVVANTPTGDQAFRISNATKSKFKIVARCYHVFYDSRNYLIEDSLVESRDCDFAIKHLNNATEPTSEFTVSSDITTLNSFRCVRKSLYEAIQTIIEKWGGHVVRDNFDIQIKSNIGQDRGIIIQYKKNIKEISSQDNWNNVVTKLLPVGKDGLLLNALNPSASKYLVSETQYDLPYTKTVSFSQNIDQKDFPSESAYKQALVNDLRAQGTAYLNKNCVPQVNYTLKANLDRVTDIGDIIEVKDERLGIDMITNVIGFVYDCISEQYNEVEFGNFGNSLSNLVGNITSSVNQNTTVQIQTATSEMSEQIKDASKEIIEMLEDSFVAFDGDKLMVYDLLPDEDAVNVLKLTYDGLSRSETGKEGTFLPVLSMAGVVNLDNLTLKKDNKAVGVFILSEGTTDGWTWRKYSSGVAEAWQSATISSGDITWSAFLTSLFKGSTTINLPFTIDNAVVTATLNESGFVSADASTSDVTLSIVRESDSGDFNINMYVRGEL